LNLTQAKELNVDFYFTKPYHSWEIGANENYNGLQRKYFPKGYNFDLITEGGILRIEEKLNNRPKKRAGYLSPNQVFSQNINDNGQVAYIS
jgi:IS30 family transposase